MSFQVGHYYYTSNPKLIVQAMKVTLKMVYFKDAVTNVKYNGKLRFDCAILRGNIKVESTRQICPERIQAALKPKPNRKIVETIVMPNGNRAKIFELLEYRKQAEYRYSCSIFGANGEYVRSIGSGYSIAHMRGCVEEVSQIQREMVR